MEKAMKHYLRKIGYDKVNIIPSRHGAYVLARDRATQRTYKFTVQTLVTEMVKRMEF